MDIPFLLINGPGGTTLSTGSDVLAKREATTVVSPTAKAAASLLALSASSTPMRELLKTLDPKQPPLPEETLITSSFTKNSLETILFSHMEIVRLHIYQEFNRVDATWGTLGEEEKWFLVPDRWQVLGRQIGSDMQQRISRPSELWVPMGAIASKGGDNVLAVDIRGSRYFLPNHPLSVLMGSLVAGDFRNPNIGEPLAWLFWLLVELYVAEMFTPQKGSGVAEAKKLLKYYAQRLQPGLVLEPVMPHVTQNWIDALADSPRAVFDPLLMTRGV